MTDHFDIRNSAFELRPDSDWFRKDDDPRWQWSAATCTGSPEGEHSQAHQFGLPPRGNANFAWVQHFIYHLAPTGMAGFVLALILVLGETQMPQSDISRGDRQRVVRVQPSVWTALSNTVR